MSDDHHEEATGVESAANGSANLPPLVAAFLVEFDLKVGYKIAWERSLPDIELQGVVEYKSLPSGLHNIEEDLVYFVHDEYAGLSAFVNGPASEAERNAHLVAVGILVPLRYGRLGRSWLHAESLQRFARALVANTRKIQPLEQYWEQYHLRDGVTIESISSPISSPALERPSKAPTPGQSNERGRSRALSTVSAFTSSDHTLPPSHPVLSILKFIDLFGPLIFPLHRAALLRKRIILSAPPPVRLPCEFVYDVSIISSISSSITKALSPDVASGVESLSRLNALFTIGIHDILLLEEAASAAQTAVDDSSRSRGFIACTTDEILAMKKKLYDIIVELPSVYHHAPQHRRWPMIKTSAGTEIKATQRDLRRYRHLRRALARMRDVSPTANNQEDEGTALINHHKGDADDHILSSEEEHLAEPISWSALAYSGFMWWASAGERDAEREHETEQDHRLLGDLSELAAQAAPASRYSDDPQTATETDRRGETPPALHTAIIAFFHRLTALILTTMAENVESASEDEARTEGEASDVVHIDSEDIRRMGLDVWSESDRVFAQDLCALYFRRKAEVHGASVECCGVRIC